MTAAHAAATAYIPAHNVAAVLSTARCNGDGLVVVPTEDGGDTATCVGCSNCTPTATPAGEHALLAAIRDRKRMLAYVADVFADCPDDEPF